MVCIVHVGTFVEKAMDCPESHPFTLDGFKSCCSEKERDPSNCPSGASGHIHEKDPVDCCQNANYVSCSYPPCKSHEKAFEIEGEYIFLKKTNQCNIIVLLCKQVLGESGESSSTVLIVKLVLM